MALPLVLKNTQLDYELCDLLGKKPEDFIIICADGVQVPFFGTPYDTPEARDSWQKIIDGMNDRRSKRWREVFEGRMVEWFHHYKLPVGTTHETFRPRFSLAISRVVAGYSKHDSAAVQLLADLGPRLLAWAVSKRPEGTFHAMLCAPDRHRYHGTGTSFAAAVAEAAHRFLTATRPAA